MLEITKKSNIQVWHVIPVLHSHLFSYLFLNNNNTQRNPAHTDVHTATHHLSFFNLLTWGSEQWVLTRLQTELKSNSELLHAAHGTAAQHTRLEGCSYVLIHCKQRALWLCFSSVALDRKQNVRYDMMGHNVKQSKDSVKSSEFHRSLLHPWMKEVFQSNDENNTSDDTELLAFGECSVKHHDIRDPFCTTSPCKYTDC